MNTIARVLELVETPILSEPDALEKKIQAVLSKKAILDNMKNACLGIERAAAEKIEDEIRKAKSSEGKLNEELAKIKRLRQLAGQYKRLSLDPLTWRNQEKYPLLVVFSVDNPQFSIQAEERGAGVTFPHLPHQITKCYDDVVEMLRKKRPHFQNISLQTTFTGLIPPDIRKKINEAREIFHGNVFVVAEAGEFQLNITTPIPQRDPLVVGYDGNVDSEHLWLIASFDTTPVEEAIRLYTGDKKPQS